MVLVRTPSRFEYPLTPKLIALGGSASSTADSKIPSSRLMSISRSISAFHIVTPAPGALDYTSDSFGKITSTRDGQNDQREIQFALKFYW